MDYIKKKALSRDNIARVFDNNDDTYGKKTKISPWFNTKKNRFVSNLKRNARPMGNIENIIKAVGNSSPIYNNALRNEPLVLLMAAQSVVKLGTIVRYSNGTAYILQSHDLLETIPFIPGVQSTRVFLSYKGFQLIDHWAEKYKRFRPYYDAFVNEDIRGKAKEYSVIRAIGGVHKDVKEIEEIKDEMGKKLLRRKKTFSMQKVIQDSIRAKSIKPLIQGCYFTTGPAGNNVNLSSQDLNVTVYSNHIQFEDK